MRDLITICIPTYRRPTMVLHCLHSCVTQDYRPLEIDIGDNSSSEETQTLVNSVPRPPGVTIRYWRNDPPTDSVENQRRLFNAARGQRLIWMNDDDVLLPGAVSAMAAAFSSAADVIATYGTQEIINLAGERLPRETARSNAYYSRTAEQAGLRRDLLVCALRRQIPNVGLLVNTEAARRTGLRSRSEIGLAVDTDFAIRLARNYEGSAFVFLNQATVQCRLAPGSLSRTEADVCWKLYDFVQGLSGLSNDEVLARDQLLSGISPVALREKAIMGDRIGAFRVLLSRTYPRGQPWLSKLYALVIIAFPDLAQALRRLVVTL